MFRRCAARLEQRRNAGAPLLSTDREMQIGFGICADWQRWSAAINEICFSERSEQRSSRTEGLTESTRFNYMWTGANALFSRNAILSLARHPNPLPSLRGEEDRFRILYDFAQIPGQLISDEEKLLNQLLSMECRAQPLPGAPVQQSYTMWEVIYYKYTVGHDRRRGIGASIGRALAAGTLPQLDAPKIIYGARNWNVHGVLLSSSFRGTRRKYVAFMNSVMLLLSEVLSRTAARLFPKI
jgi:hypothetical protein